MYNGIVRILYILIRKLTKFYNDNILHEDYKETHFVNTKLASSRKYELKYPLH